MKLLVSRHIFTGWHSRGFSKSANELSGLLFSTPEQVFSKSEFSALLKQEGMGVVFSVILG